MPKIEEACEPSKPIDTTVNMQRDSSDYVETLKTEIEFLRDSLRALLHSSSSSVNGLQRTELALLRDQLADFERLDTTASASPVSSTTRYQGQKTEVVALRALMDATGSSHGLGDEITLLREQLTYLQKLKSTEDELKAVIPGTSETFHEGMVAVEEMVAALLSELAEKKVRHPQAKETLHVRVPLF